MLSEYDSAAEAEGSIDPLGLQPTYERLADRLLPAVTVRMGRPRFVTAMAVGACVCQEWPLETLAADKISPPWLVYEWFVVEAFVRSNLVLQGGQGIPGVLKAQRALYDQRPLSASSYLKTPTVFGFSGIFRRLARYLRVLTAEGRLDDVGYELVDAWSADQDCPGFLDARGSVGATFRDQLRHAVRQGLEKGHTTRQSVAFCDEIATKLHPAHPGKRERQLLIRLLEQAGPPTVMHELVPALRKRRAVVEFINEAKFLDEVLKTANADLSELISAIASYEKFARIITDAFEALRYASSTAKGALIGYEEFVTCVNRDCTDQLSSAIRRIRAHATLLQWEPSLENFLSRFEQVRTPKDLYATLLDHHDVVQREKPPNGKRTWFERERGERVLVRPDYMLDDPPLEGGSHVHDYRVSTYSRFLADLGAFA